MSSTASQILESFPALEEMGIVRAHQISSYKLKSRGASADVLKVRYKREKGSLLPASRTYHFGRSLKTVLADGGTARMEHTYEISPFLLKAVAELDALVKDNKSVDNKIKSKIGEEQVGELLKELHELESMVSAKVAKMDAAALSARFSRLKVQIAAL